MQIQIKEGETDTLKAFKYIPRKLAKIIKLLEFKLKDEQRKN